MIMHTQIVHCVAVLFYMTSIALTTSNVHGMSVLAFAAVGARSHQFCVLRIGQALAARGHNFTLLISDQDDLGLDKLGSTALVGLDLVTFRGPPFVGTDLWNQQRSRDLLEGYMQDISLQEEMLEMALALYADKDTLQKLLAADALNIPSIDVFSFAPLQPIFGDYASIPHPAAYLPQLGSGLTTNMNFLQRCQNYLYKLFGESGPIGGIELFQNKFLKKSGLEVQTYEQGYSSSVAGISAGDWAIEFPHAMALKVHVASVNPSCDLLLTNTCLRDGHDDDDEGLPFCSSRHRALQLVGPISADPAKALPADLSAFVEGGQAAGQGAVYVSMGTASRLTEAELHSLAGSLSALPNPVLWKLAPQDLPGNMNRTSIEASNIKFISWAPQNDVLGHSAVKAFVTHAGSNSIYEAGFHGKPVVCIPLLADQFDHAAKAAYHGFGLSLTPKQLKTSKPMIQANAQKVQRRLMINKPRHPAELAADIVERVVAAGAEPYLDIRMPSLAWWQLALLDVKLVLLTIGMAAIMALFCGLWAMVWAINAVIAGSGEHELVQNHEHQS